MKISELPVDSAKLISLLLEEPWHKDCSIIPDLYGEDMQTVELAIIALSKAPTPRYVGPITFSIPLPPLEVK